jgi:hypothetical protein
MFFKCGICTYVEGISHILFQVSTIEIPTETEENYGNLARIAAARGVIQNPKR